MMMLMVMMMDGEEGHNDDGGDGDDDSDGGCDVFQCCECDEGKWEDLLRNTKNLICGLCHLLGNMRHGGAEVAILLPVHTATLHTQSSLHTQHKTLVHGPKHRHCWYEDRHLSGRRWYQGSTVLGFCGVLECLDRTFDNQFKCIVELMGR